MRSVLPRLYCSSPTVVFVDKTMVQSLLLRVLYIYCVVPGQWLTPYPTMSCDKIEDNLQKSWNSSVNVWHTVYDFLGWSDLGEKYRECVQHGFISHCQLIVRAVCHTFVLSQKEYFQDDIFSDTTVTWEPAINAADWLDGGNKEQRKISLRPSDMKLRKFWSGMFSKVLL